MTTTKKSAVFKVTGHGHDAEWRHKLLTVCSFFFFHLKNRVHQKKTSLAPLIKRKTRLNWVLITYIRESAEPESAPWSRSLESGCTVSLLVLMELQ